MKNLLFSLSLSGKSFITVIAQPQIPLLDQNRSGITWRQKVASDYKPSFAPLHQTPILHSVRKQRRRSGIIGGFPLDGIAFVYGHHIIFGGANHRFCKESGNNERQ